MEQTNTMRRRRNFSPPNKTITDDDKRFMVEQYVTHKKSANEILKMFNGKFKTTKTVYDVLKQFDIKGRELQDYINIDHLFFSEINTSAKAYILGLFITDGWVISDKGAFGIQLTMEDENIIKMIRKELKSDTSLVTCYKKPFEGANGNIYQPKDMIRFFAHSKQIVNDLSRYGVINNKSDKTLLPLIGPNFMPHMLRGILDGDGSVYIHAQSNNLCIRFIGTRVLVAQISMFLALALGVKYNYPNIRTKQKETYMDICYVDWESKEEVEKIIRYIYKDSDEDHRIRRKYEKAKDYII